MISIATLTSVVQKASDDFDHLATDDASFAHFIAERVAGAINKEARKRGKKPVVTPK